MAKESTIQELSRSHVLLLDQEDIFSIPMEEVACTITMAPRMVMAMEVLGRSRTLSTGDR